MSLYALYETDKQAEQDGIPVEFPANSDKTIPTFYLGRTGRVNKDWGKEYDRLTRDPRFVTKLRLNEMKAEDWETIGLETFLKATLKGWQNVQGRDGKALPFTPANAKQLMDDLPELYAKLQEYASTADNFRKSAQEADTGN